MAKTKINEDKILYGIIGILVILFVGYIIYKQIKEHFAQDDPKLQELKKQFMTFFDKDQYWSSPLEMLNNNNVIRDIKLYRGDKSYTINKEKVYLCLKDSNGHYYENNTLVYVFAHELAHVLCDEIGHTEKFHKIFDALLIELAKEGIFNPSSPIISDYCENGDPEM